METLLDEAYAKAKKKRRKVRWNACIRVRKQLEDASTRAT
jgi:hypothetical protein